MLRPLILSFLLIIAACGGGSDSAPSTPPQWSPGPGSTLADIEQQVRIGQYGNVHSVIVYEDAELKAEW